METDVTAWEGTFAGTGTGDKYIASASKGEVRKVEKLITANIVAAGGKTLEDLKEKSGAAVVNAPTVVQNAYQNMTTAPLASMGSAASNFWEKTKSTPGNLWDNTYWTYRYIRGK
jgi:hypothetical protein